MTLGFGYDFFDTIPKAGSIKERTDKLDFIKIKNLCSVKDNIKRMERQATGWGKISTKGISNKGLLSKIYKEFLKLNNKKTNTVIFKKWVKELNGHFTKEDIQMVY